MVRMAGVDPEWSHSMAHALALDARTWPRGDVPGLGLTDEDVGLLSGSVYFLPTLLARVPLLPTGCRPWEAPSSLSGLGNFPQCTAVSSFMFSYVGVGGTMEFWRLAVAFWLEESRRRFSLDWVDCFKLIPNSIREFLWSSPVLRPQDLRLRPVILPRCMHGVVPEATSGLEAAATSSDEAARAKEIAENKFKERDLQGAKRLALKAQSLFDGLEGVDQMIATINVYIASEVKVDGEHNKSKVFFHSHEYLSLICSPASRNATPLSTVTEQPHYDPTNRSPFQLVRMDDDVEKRYENMKSKTRALSNIV
ncbi:hypothetical protein EJB05_29248, partial [Eragrostis curvula]